MCAERLRAATSFLPRAAGAIGLTEDQTEFLNVAERFAENEILPFASEWDQKKHFPHDMLKNAAALGFGGSSASTLGTGSRWLH